MKKFKKFAALAMALVLALSFAACSSDAPASSAPASSTPAADPADPWANSESIQNIKKAGKIVMGTSADYAPFEFHTMIDGVDTIVGFDIELGKIIADSLGVELEVIDMAFDSLLIGVNNGEFDFVLASMSENPERAKAVEFSDAYYKGQQLIVVRAEDAEKYADGSALMGQPVSVQKGTIQVPFAEQYAGAENVVHLVKVGDMIAELEAGKVEACFVDGHIALGYDAKNENLVALDIGIVHESEGSAAACAKGNTDLADYISEVLNGLTQEQKDQMLGEAQALAGIEE